MKKRKTRLLAAVLAAVLLLTGCSERTSRRLEELRGSITPLQTEQRETHPAQNQEVTFREMVYVRPDMEALEDLLEQARMAARDSDAEAVLDAVDAFYEEYDWFYTRYSLADIHYSQDLTDEYWETEYAFCVENAAQADAWQEDLFYALAQSPCRRTLERDYFGEGFFDYYDEDENGWDEEFTELLRQEGALQNRYYELCAQQPLTEADYDAGAREKAQILVDLVGLRREMTEYWGYESYADFAWDFYYYRDYTPEEVEAYLGEVCRELVPLYRELVGMDVWDAAYAYAPRSQTLGHVRAAAEGLGGTVLEAFQRMEAGELYDIDFGANKYGTSFEVWLESYGVPFVFVCPYNEVYDRLTFAHEFGHFCNDYASSGSGAGVDVLEIFSQGMEYLSLPYGEDPETLTRVKLADSLCTYVEQAAYAVFELRLYALPEEKQTVEGLFELYDQVARDFGFDSVGYDRREFVDVSHFYTDPMYIVSYVVSNDAAMQLYELEQAQPGAGAERYLQHLDTWEVYFLAFLEEADLESPFAPGRLQAVKELFRQKLFA